MIEANTRSRCICVQRDPDAVVNLGMDWNEHFDVCEIEPSVWAALDEDGFWDELGAVCGVIIDEHEEEEVDREKVSAGRDFIASYCRRPSLSAVLKAALSEMKVYFELALERDTPVLVAG